MLSMIILIIYKENFQKYKMYLQSRARYDNIVFIVSNKTVIDLIE